MLIIKGDTVLDVTPKAYEVIYKDHDFTIKEKKQKHRSRSQKKNRLSPSSKRLWLKRAKPRPVRSNADYD